MTAITTVEVLRPGLSLQRRGRSAGDYFELKGEPRRRWWMGAAPELALSGTRRSAARSKAAERVEALYQAKLAAERYATH